MLPPIQNKACFAYDGSDLRQAVDTILESNDDIEIQQIYDLYGESMNEWCVDHVRDFSHLFANQPDFNEDLSSWNTSSAVTFAYTFQNAQSFNGDLSSWKVGSVMEFSHMFDGASSMQQDFCEWGPQIISHQLASKNIMMEDMFVGTLCLDPASPLIHVEKQVMGPFCTPCGLAKEVIASRPSSFGPANVAESNQPGDNPTSHKDAQQLFDSVHSHEPAARGAQIVLMMLLFSSLNILLIASWAQRRMERQQETSTTNNSTRRRDRSLAYAQLSNTEDATSEDEETEMAQVIGTSLSLIEIDDGEQSFEDVEEL